MHLAGGFYQLCVFTLADGTQCAFVGPPSLPMTIGELHSIRVSAPKAIPPGETLETVLFEFMNRMNPPVTGTELRCVITGVAKPIKPRTP